MISCNLKGGLGNMMFQIAAAYALSYENNDHFLINKNNYSKRHYSLDHYKNNIFRNIEFGDFNAVFIHKEQSFRFEKIKYIKDIIIDGYFQSEKYFLKYRKKILDLFSIDSESGGFIYDKYKHINFKESCSLHVRRADYLKYPNIHPTCDISYYYRSIEMVDSKNILIFSDDLDWCEKNLIINNKNIFYIKNNPDYIDLWIMSLCENNIIANSTFSWWGAWLNQNKNKLVIAPNKWFGDSLQHNTEDLYFNGVIKL